MTDNDKARMFNQLALSVGESRRDEASLRRLAPAKKEEALLLGLIFRLGPLADYGLISEAEHELLWSLITKAIANE